MMLSGEDWNGLTRVSRASWMKGPMYCCFVNSLCNILLKVSRCTVTEGLLGGVNDWVMVPVGVHTCRPCINCSRRAGCLCNRLSSINKSHQPSTLYSVTALLCRCADSVLVEGAFLGSVVGVPIA